MCFNIFCEKKLEPSINGNVEIDRYAFMFTVVTGSRVHVNFMGCLVTFLSTPEKKAEEKQQKVSKRRDEAKGLKNRIKTRQFQLYWYQKQRPKKQEEEEEVDVRTYKIWYYDWKATLDKFLILDSTLFTEEDWKTTATFQSPWTFIFVLVYFKIFITIVIIEQEKILIWL